MKASKIIGGLLILIGFGSCANRPAKSKAAGEQPRETEVIADSVDVVPMRVMYGAPYRRFDPTRAPEDVQQGTEDTASEANQPEDK